MPSTTAAKPLVLITGATGHIGFATLRQLLQSGYAARITTRKLASAEGIKHAASMAPYRDSMSFIEVPDVLASGAYDAAARDVAFILHLAAPIPNASLVGNPRKHYIDPAVQGTLNMLRAAAQSPSVQRVVITSSVVVLDVSAAASGAFVGPDSLAPVPREEDVGDDSRAAYAAAKIIAHHAGLRWMEEHRPQFDLVYVLPAYVQGRNELVTRKEDVGNGSNDVMMKLVLGGKTPEPWYANTVLVDDVAEVEVKALDRERVKGGDCLIASSGKAMVWNDVSDIARELFPEAVEKGVLPLGGEQGSMAVNLDVSYTEEVTGVKFKGLREQVKSLIGQYVELAAR